MFIGCGLSSGRAPPGVQMFRSTNGGQPNRMLLRNYIAPLRGAKLSGTLLYRHCTPNGVRSCRAPSVSNNGVPIGAVEIIFA